MSMENPTYFQLLKCEDTILPSNKISDRLIVTRGGNVYFDYSENERIEISTSAGSSLYKYTNIEKPFGDVDTEIQIPVNYLKTVTGEDITEIKLYGLILDELGNIAIVIKTNNGQMDKECIAKVLSNNNQFILNKIGIKRITNISNE